MLFEQCFAGQPSVNARDMAASWRPSYGEWLGAQAAEGFDRTITGRYLEEKGIALAEMRAGDYDPAWSLRNNETMSPMERAFVLKGWMPPAPEHAHAMTEADWKASPWYRKEISFRPDMTATRARIMAENFDRRRYRERLLARGNELYDDAEDMALGFGAGLLGSLPDPINLLPLGGGAAAGSGAATLGRALLRGAKAGAVNGAVSTAVSDALVLPDLASRGEDADFVDLLLDTLAGGFLGGVFGTIGGAFGRHAAQRRKRAKAVPDASGEAAAARAGDAAVDAESLPARNADNDLLRQGWTAGERRAVATAADLGMEALSDGRPADVSAALRDSGVLERTWRAALSPVVVRSEDLGVPEGAGLTEYIAAAKVYHDALKLESESGKPVIQPQLEKPVRFSRKGWSKNKSNGADADKWKLFPKLREIIESSTLKSTEELKKKRADDFVRFHWVENVVELDGSPRLVGVMLAEDSKGNLFYNINADVEGWRAKKGGSSSLPADSNAGVSEPPIQAEAAAPPVSSRLAEEGAGVNLHVEDIDGLSPDFSTAAEPPAPSRMTPEAARQAEAGALAGQDESLRQRLADVEKRGAVDAGETAARTEDGLAGVPGSEARKK